LLLAALCGTSLAHADELQAEELLRANTHQITLDDHGVSGTGADLILRLAEDAQFVALGEEHYNLHIPAVTTALFRELQEQYEFRYFMTEQDPKPGSRAAWLIDVLINGNTVFGFYYRGEEGLVPGYYENNRFREEHLKDLCLDKYQQAAQADPFPKSLMKFGSGHLYEGLSPTRIHTIGDFFSNVARFNGYGFLSINFVSLPEDPEASMKNLGYAWPFISNLDPEEFAVIDLRPFRHYRHRVLLEEAGSEEWRSAYKEDFVRLVYGYDLLFFVGKTQPATFNLVPAVD